MKFIDKLFSIPWFSFLFIFLFCFPVHYFLWNSEKDLLHSLIYSFVIAIGATLLDRYVNLERTPFYFKLRDYDKLLKYLDTLDAQLVKTKNEKQYYKLKGKWRLNNKIIIKKTPFYLYADVPDKLVDHFIQLKEKVEKE